MFDVRTTITSLDKFCHDSYRKPLNELVRFQHNANIAHSEALKRCVISIGLYSNQYGLRNPIRGVDWGGVFKVLYHLVGQDRYAPETGLAEITSDLTPIADDVKRDFEFPKLKSGFHHILDIEYRERISRQKVMLRCHFVRMIKKYIKSWKSRYCQKIDAYCTLLDNPESTSADIEKIRCDLITLGIDSPNSIPVVIRSADDKRTLNSWCNQSKSQIQKESNSACSAIHKLNLSFFQRSQQTFGPFKERIWRDICFLSLPTPDPGTRTLSEHCRRTPSVSLDSTGN